MEQVTDHKMKVDIIELLIVFDELITPPTNEELGVYWFGANRTGSLKITLSFSIYELYVCVLVHTPELAIASIHMKNCSEIRVLNTEKKCLEFVHDGKPGKCLLQLTGDPLLTYDE